MSKIYKKIKTLLHLDLKWALKYYKKNISIRLNYLISKLLNKKFLNIIIDGITLKLFFSHPYHYLIAKSFKKNEFERQLLEIWKKQSKKIGGVILDIGGYNGIYGLVAASANPNAEIFIFEPDQINYEHIACNIEKNNLKNIKVVKKAVFNKTGVVHFREHNGGTGGNIQNDEAGEMTVECISLDDWAKANNKTPTLIKIDVEGAEYKALAGGQTALSNPNLQILLEIHTHFLQRFNNTVDELWNLLDKLQFDSIWLDENQLTLHHWLFKQSQKKTHI